MAGDVDLVRGEQIIGEFPNTRIGSEIKELMPKLREVAGHFPLSAI